jgi:transcriptional regulator with XRE-family HTH domain
MTTLTDWGAAVRDLRTRMGITQSALARELGISQQLLAMREANRNTRMCESAALQAVKALERIHARNRRKLEQEEVILGEARRLVRL